MNKHDELIERAKNHCSAKGTFPLIDELADAIKELVAENAEITERSTVVHEANEELSVALIKAEAERDELVAENAYLKQAVQHANDHADAAIQDMQKAEAERDELRSVYADLQDAEKERDQAQALAAAIQRETIERCANWAGDYHWNRHKTPEDG